MKGHQVKVQYKKWKVENNEHSNTEYRDSCCANIFFDASHSKGYYEAKTCKNYYARHHHDIEQGDCEGRVISAANAIVQPNAVVVKVCHAPVTAIAMFSAKLFTHIALVTKRHLGVISVRPRLNVFPLFGTWITPSNIAC